MLELINHHYPSPIGGCGPPDAALAGSRELPRDATSWMVGPASYCSPTQARW
jgi:hypothetical protein